MGKPAIGLGTALVSGVVAWLLSQSGAIAVTVTLLMGGLMLILLGMIAVHQEKARRMVLCGNTRECGVGVPYDFTVPKLVASAGGTEEMRWCKVCALEKHEYPKTATGLRACEKCRQRVPEIQLVEIPSAGRLCSRCRRIHLKAAESNSTSNS